MGGAVSLTRKTKADGKPQEADSVGGSEREQLPNRGILRTLGFKRSAVSLPHPGSWLEVSILEAENLPANDDNGARHECSMPRLDAQTTPIPADAYEYHRTVRPLCRSELRRRLILKKDGGAQEDTQSQVGPTAAPGGAQRSGGGRAYQEGRKKRMLLVSIWKQTRTAGAPDPAQFVAE